MLADSTKVLYRPVRDLSGIPGSKSLHICLTGYQRQERDDIMRMVSLMGGIFSKPLIASQVTHLICYKFEGEKYELAKKVNIKLVNHRWLEDCLKAWEILPVDNYNKSGLEIEILEAEAMDSEEETEDSFRKIKDQSSVGEPHSSRGEISAIMASDALADTTKFSLQKDISKPFDLSIDNQLISTPQKENISGKANSICDIKGNVPKLLGHPEGRATEQFSDNNGISIINSKPNTPSSNYLSMKSNSLPFNVKNSLMATTSCEEGMKLSPLRYFRKASEKIVSPEEQFSNFCPPHKGKTEEVNLKGGANSSFTELKNNDVNKCINSNLHSPMTDLAIPHVEGQTHNLPQKRKLSVSRIGSKSMKSDNISRTSGLLNAPTSINSAELDSLESQHQEPEDMLTNIETNTSTFHMVEDNDSFPQMQKLSASNSYFSSPKFAQEDSRTCTKQSLSTSMTPGLSKSTGALQNEIDHSLSHSDDCEGTSLVQPRGNPHGLMSKSSSLGYKRKSVKHGHSSSVANMSDNSSSKSDNKDVLLSAPSKPVFDGSVCTRYGAVSGIGTMCNLTSDAIVLSDCPQNNGTGLAEIRSTGNDPNLSRSLRVGDGGNANEASNGVRVLKASLKSMKKSETADKPHNFDIASINSKSEINNEASEQHEKRDKDEEVMPSSLRDAEVKSFINTEISGNCKQSKENEGSIHCNRKALVSRKNGSMPKARRKNGCKDKRSGESLRSINSNKTANNSGKGLVELGNEDSLKEKVGKEDSSLEEKTEVEQYDPPESYSKAIQGDKHLDPEKESKLKHSCNISIKDDKDYGHKVKKQCKSFLVATSSFRENISSLPKQNCPSVVLSEPMYFILSGNRDQRKEFQTIINQLRGRICKGSHNWSYQATHFIVPDSVRRTEKFFAAAAAGRWILRADYLTASREAGKFLDEEPFEWHRNGFTEDGSISLDAPRKWRTLKQTTGCGAFYGMRIIIYGDCIAPSLDTLKRVVKAGDGTILATSPPYTRFLKSGVDFAIVSPSMPHIDIWVQEFLRHEIPCILADYLVEYVCKPGYSLDKHVLYKTHQWVKKSMENLQSRCSEEMVSGNGSNEESSDDLICSVCGSGERGEVLLLCGNQSGTLGCGVGTHIGCCDPPLSTVPEDDWFCSRCSKNSGHKTLTKSTKAKPKKGKKVK